MLRGTQQGEREKGRKGVDRVKGGKGVVNRIGWSQKGGGG